MANGVTGVTAEQIRAAADAIASEGGRPSIRGVRERLGNTGSLGTIQRYLAEWREDRPQVVQAAYELPGDLANAFGRELRRGAEAATAELRAENAQALIEAKEQGIEIESLESTVDELRARSDELEGERDRAQTEAQARAEEIERLSAQVREEKAAAAELMQKLATATVKIETQAEQLDDQKRQWSEHVASLKAEIADYHQKLEVARDNAQEAEQRAAVAESKAEAKAEKADDLKDIVSGLRTELAEARAETKAAREQAAKDAEAWRQQIALEHKRNAELQSERDSLAERVAVLEQQQEKEQGND